MALIPLKSKSTSARSVPLSCTCTTWAFAALKDLLNMLSETTIQNPWTWLTLLRLPPRLTSRNPSDSHSTRCRKVPQTVLSIGAPDFVQTKKCPSESPFCLLRQLQVRLVLQVLPSIPGSKRNTHTPRRLRPVTGLSRFTRLLTATRRAQIQARVEHFAAKIPEGSQSPNRTYHHICGDATCGIGSFVAT